MSDKEPLRDIGYSSVSYRNLMAIQMHDTQIVFEMRRGYFSSLEHYHAIYELYFVLDGQLEVKCEDTVYTLRKNSLFLIPPWKRHKAADITGGSDILNLLFMLDKAPAGSGSRRIFSEATHQDKDPFIKHDEINIGRYFFRICKEYGHEQAFSSDILSALYHLIFAELARILAGSLSTNIPAITSLGTSQSNIHRFVFINDVLKVFMREYIEDLTLESLARRFWVSPSHMRRLLLEYYNKGFQEILSETRMMAATHLLRLSDLSISQIAEKCGYHSYENFCKSFHKAKGMPPSTYRSQYSVPAQNEQDHKTG